MLTIQYANVFKRTETHSRIKINTATPGFIATDLNEFKGTGTVQEGARIVIELATLEDEGLLGDFSTTLALCPNRNMIPLEVNHAQTNPGTTCATLGSR